MPDTHTRHRKARCKKPVVGRLSIHAAKKRILDALHLFSSSMSLKADHLLKAAAAVAAVF